MQHIKSIQIGWIEISRLYLSFNKVSWDQTKPSIISFYKQHGFDLKWSNPRKIGLKLIHFFYI